MLAGAAMPAEPVKASRRRLFTWLGIAAVVALGLLLLLAVAVPRITLRFGLDGWATPSTRFHHYSDMRLPGSAEVVTEAYENWAFIDPQYRIVFHVAEKDARDLLDNRPPWAQGEWKEGARVDGLHLFGAPEEILDGTHTIFGTHGTTVHRGLKVDINSSTVEFAYSEM